MSEVFSGKVEVQDASTQTTITLNGDNASVRIGGDGHAGFIRLDDATGTARIALNANQGDVFVQNKSGNQVISMRGDTGVIAAGANGIRGTLRLADGDGEHRIRLETETGGVFVGGHGANGLLVLFPSNGDNSTFDESTALLSGQDAALRLGGNSQSGAVTLRNGGGVNRIELHAGNGRLVLRSAAWVEVVRLDGDTGEIILRGVNPPGHGLPRIRLNPGGANIYVGGNGQDGDLVLFRAGGDNQTAAAGTIHLNGEAGNMRLGANGTSGRVSLDGPAGESRVVLDAAGGNIWLGGHGADGDLVIFPKSATQTDTTDQATIHLNGDAGDIILKNADCAEDFDAADGEPLEPGVVVVLDAECRLRRCTEAYDRRVAGVISGAGNYKPGLLLDRRVPAGNRKPVALAGKVHCRVDARYASIAVGDLLTSSPTAGCAMKAVDSARSFGAVIGKALKALDDGDGLIPILVALQ